jgi:polyhydroxyalkanoate synthesis regulator phasin
MRKTIVAATVGASIAVGGLVGSALGGPGLAGAADLAGVSDEDGDGSGWVQDALDGLVDEGTITQDQADSVEDALADARPEGHGPGHRFLAHDLADIAEALGVEEDDVRAALEDGRTIAELAEEQGVEVSDVVDAIVSAQRERLDQAVADGDLTQEEADRILAASEERVTAFVEGEVPPMPDMSEPPDMPHGDGERFGPPGMGHGGPDEWHVPRGSGGEDERSRGSEDGESFDDSDEGDADSGGASTEPTAAVGV